ncbi:integumentary mucin A.1-like [Haliotis asinina]|uniref:integumentary mucin A.1-like n=1 Tax=Haliotis asinina TaxID=109174 RepID=UPI00353188DA
MELTTSKVIPFQFFVVFCNGINPTSIVNLGGSYDKILLGHGYDLLKVKTLEHCHRICLYSPKCLSVNWNTKTKYCQLNSEDVGSGTPPMMSTGDLYVPALSSNIKNHACSSTPCKFGEVCIPVTSAADFVCLLPDDQKSSTTTNPTATTPSTTTPITTISTTTTPPPTTTPTPTATTPSTTTITTISTTTTLSPTATSTPTATTPSTTTTITTISTTTTLSPTATSTPTATTSTPSTTTAVTTISTTTTLSPTATSTPTATTPSTTTTITTADCSTYSDSFTRIQGYTVWLSNNKTFTDVSSVSACEDYCVQEKAFTCTSYEYYHAQKWCFLQSFVKDDALSQWTADSRAEYFERLRQCDVTP